MQSVKGFTILELLLVCMIVGIFGGLSMVLLRGAIQTARLREGSAQFAADLQRARSSAQRFNQASTLTLSSTLASSYTLSINGQTSTHSLPAGVQIASSANARVIAYSAPFGEITGTNNVTFTVGISGQDKTSLVKVLGVTGKVYSEVQ